MKLKKFLPFENYVLTSNLSAEEITKRLNENVEPKRGFKFFAWGNTSDKPYEGQVLSSTFTISRIIYYRNSFLPIITGRISTFLGRTQINIKMRLATPVLVFISLWLGIVGIVCLGIILSAFFQVQQVLQNGFSPIILMPFGMFLFGCLLTTLAFKAESKKSKAFLEKILEGQENT